jgi:hypothetical protein
MSKAGSSAFSVLLADGYNLLAAKLKGFTYGTESLTEPTDGLGDDHEEHTPVNMSRSTLAQNGAFFDDATNGIHLAFRASSGVARILTFAFMGNVIGAAFTGALGALKTRYDVLVQVGGLTKANASYLVDGAVDDGVILQSHTAQTVDWNTEGADSVDYTLDPLQRVIPITSNSLANPSVVTTPVPHGLTTGDIIFIAGVITSSPTINGERTVTVISPTTFSVPVNVVTGGTGGTFVRANSSGGGVGYQQVSAFSGFTGFVGKIRDSPDDITYADLLTFVNVTSAPNGQRVTVAGVVDRHLSYTGDVTGSGSITPFAGFSRG